MSAQRADGEDQLAVAGGPLRTRFSENANRDERGLLCPACGCRHLRVVYTRPTWGSRIMRRRECRHCGQRVSTWETAGAKSTPKAFDRGGANG